MQQECRTSLHAASFSSFCKRPTTCATAQLIRWCRSLMVFRWWNCLAGGQNGIHDLQEVLVDHILVSKNEGHILNCWWNQVTNGHQVHTWQLWEKGFKSINEWLNRPKPKTYQKTAEKYWHEGSELLILLASRDVEFFQVLRICLQIHVDQVFPSLFWGETSLSMSQISQFSSPPWTAYRLTKKQHGNLRTFLQFKARKAWQNVMNPYNECFALKPSAFGHTKKSRGAIRTIKK